MIIAYEEVNIMMNKVIEKRKSVREYQNKSLSALDSQNLKKYFAEMPRLGSDDSIDYKYYDDGKAFQKSLKGLIGYNGIMIEAPQYVVITAKKGKENLKSAGYASEWLLLKLSQDEVGSCQISTEGNEDKIDAILEVKDGYTTACIMAIGYPKKPSFLASIFGNQERTSQQSVENVDSFQKLSDRMGGDEFVFIDEFGKKADLSDDNENIAYYQAFYYMRFAPSSLNRQPWKFVIAKDGILLLVDKGDSNISENTVYIEAGIAMLYFTVAMNVEGYTGTWDIADSIDKLGAPDEYVVAGKYISNN